MLRNTRLWLNPWAQPMAGFSLGCLALLCASCASGPHTRQPQLDAAFKRIQLAEARIAHARAALDPGGDPASRSCSSARTAAADAQRAADELCAIAHDIADADALTRCEQARRTTASIVARARRRCGSAEQERT